MRKPKAKPRWWIRVARTGLLFGALYLGGCYALASYYLSPTRSHPRRPDGLAEAQVDTTPCWITPKLGSGRPSRVVFVLVHGYGGDRSQWDDLMPALTQRGFETIAPAMPAHDSNPDPTTGFGYKEADVIVRCVAWVRARGAQRVVVCGVSLGGSAAWLATERTSGIDAVISEGSFARFDLAMNRWLDLVLPGGHVLLRPVVWIATGKSGIDPSRIVPEDAARKWRGRPALVIQGDSDALMEMSQARRLSQAAAAPLWIVKGAPHASCYACARDEYVGKLVALAHGL